MNWNAIYSAIEQKFISMNLGVDFVPDNTDYDDALTNPYVRVYHEVADTDPLCIGSHGVMETVGISTFCIYFPAGDGGGAATSLADTIAQTFKPGLSLPAGTGYVTISKSSLGRKEPTKKPNWERLPLFVHYNAFHSY